MREIERAVSKSIPVVPFRIEQAAPSKDLEYFISSTHWLDAMEGPLDQHLNRLSETVKFLLASRGPKKDLEAKDSETAAVDDKPAPPKPVPPKAAAVPPKPAAKPAPAGGGRWVLGSAVAVVILAIGLGGFWMWRGRQHPAPPLPEVLSPQAQMAQMLDKLSASKVPEASDPKASEEILAQVKSLRIALDGQWLETKSSNPDEGQLRKKILSQSSDYLNSLQKVMDRHPDVEREAGLALARLGELQFSESQPDRSDKPAAESSFHAAATHLGKIAEASPADALVASSLRTVQQRLTAIETPPPTDTPETGDAKPEAPAPVAAKKAVEKKPQDTPALVARTKKPVIQELVSPAPPTNPQSGVLHYVGPPVPFNGTVEFDNLPGERLKFSFDTSLWQLLIQKQPNGLKKLILRSKKQDVQTTCDGTWEIVK
jgi:hypothetical protein